jgi:VWFA-related protein
MPRALRIALALLIGVGAPAAQDRQLPRFQSGVELVTVDVTVVDTDGRPIADLRPSDFAVEVDGTGRRVVSADWVQLAPAESKPAVERTLPSAPTPYTSNSNTEGGRYIVLFIDRVNIRFGGLLAHRDAINRFVDGLQPTDRVAVVTAGFGSGNSVGFTTNHQRVKDSVMKITGQRGVNAGVPEPGTTVQPGSPLTAGAPPHHELREVLRALKPIDAPKTIVLISEGFAASNFSA